MAYAFTQDVPIGMEVYRQIRAELGDRPPPGLVVHVVIELEKGLRYLDVWESQEAHRRFVETTLHPIVARVLARAGVARAGEPTTQPITVREVWAGAPLPA
ncbi:MULTISPECIES: hypothetical protein [unclassified Anaeromyxobacter]|uniref:hypothetical protein n=1 Tax=unclassified Anaeromyxobacter TaxID=2620896 RepID=UPI001F591C06|nr:MULTISPECIES: hypothetical protein [unclassified Anaeromyxobacter]